jgi:DNA-directed RNA polymerase specialized sigma24 family protein
LPLLPKDKAIKEVTQEKFEAFLHWLSPEKDKAGEEYERLRFRLTTFFAARNCRFPEDLADETINRVIIKSNELTIENKLAFCYGTAKNVFLESLRKEKNHINIDDIEIAAKPVEPQFADKCLEKCLGKLSTENRTLIIDYFSESKSAKITLREKISETLGITQTNLRMKVVRIKQKLKKCLIECSA